MNRQIAIHVMILYTYMWWHVINVFMVRMLQIYSVTFKYRTPSLPIVTMLYIRSSEFIIITESLYPLTYMSPFLPPPFPNLMTIAKPHSKCLHSTTPQCLHPKGNKYFPLERALQWDTKKLCFSLFQYPISKNKIKNKKNNTLKTKTTSSQWTQKAFGKNSASVHD